MLDEKSLIMENEHLKISLSWISNLKIDEFINKATMDNALKNGKELKLFVINTEKGQINANDFIGNAEYAIRNGKQILKWNGICDRLDLKAELIIEVGSNPETLLSFYRA